MKRLLQVSNGNGEIAIADRIAREVVGIAPDAQIDHLALVGVARSAFMRDVGPQQRMPSGGLIAMGQVKNIARDLRGGLAGLTLAQRKFLTNSRGRYDRVVAVGDVYALLMALAVRAPTTYVGTAKSVRVAPYGFFERRILRRADQIFVRDSPTAQRLQSQDVDAVAPGNVIVDLFAGDSDERIAHAVDGFAPALAIFPGSRDAAYCDAAFLCDIARRIASAHPCAGAVLSIAPMLDVGRFAQELSLTWSVCSRNDSAIPFELRDADRTIVRAWRGSLGALLQCAQVVIGQAGTANEAAAAAGIPVVAFERGSDRKTAWYRMRQSGLLGDALAVFAGEPALAAQELAALLGDTERRGRMGAAGRTLMGPTGGAHAIARAIVGPT